MNLIHRILFPENSDFHQTSGICTVDTLDTEPFPRGWRNTVSEGRPLNVNGWRGGNMEIWMTASTSNAQFSAAFEAARQIMEAAFNSRFAGTPYGPGLIELQYRALPHAPRMRRYGEVKKYFRALHSVHIRTRLEMPPDLNGNDVLCQIALSLERTVERLRNMRIPDFDFERFASDFAQFNAEREWAGTMCESVIAASEWPMDECGHRLQETVFDLDLW